MLARFKKIDRQPRIDLRDQMQQHRRIRPERGDHGDIASQQLLHRLPQHAFGIHLAIHAVERDDAELAQLVVPGFGGDHWASG